MSSNASTKKRGALRPRSIMKAGGMPSTLTILATWSASSRPSNSGSPVCSSTRMQPSDHMSMGHENSQPSSTSGDR
jgi:hypothetical protein